MIIFSYNSFKNINKALSTTLITTITISLILFIFTHSTPSYGNDWYKEFNLNKVTRYSEVFNANVTFYTSKNKVNTPSITLIHGVGGSAEDFKRIVKNLSKHYQLFIPDLPGYGRSMVSKNTYLPSKYAEALADILPTLVKKNNIVVGHSMGGNISTQLALNHPELASKLVLIDAAGFINKFAYSQYMALNYAKDKADLIEKEIPLLKGFIKTVNEFLPDPSKILLSDAGRKYALGDNSSLISALAVLDENLTTLIRKPAPPTHIIWGDQDRAMPIQVAGLLSYLLNTRSVEVYKNTGHSPQKEHPTQVAQSIHQFIQHNESVKIIKEKIKRFNTNITINCKNNQTVNLLNNAEYQQVTLLNCNAKNQIKNLVAHNLVIKNSNVNFANLTLKSPNAFSFIALHSELAIWGGRLEGLSVGYIEESHIEIHGADIFTNNALVVSNVPDTMNVSLTQVYQNGRRFDWHGIVNVGF